MEVENRYITIKNYINGNPSESDLELRSARLTLKIEEEGSEGMIVKNLYVSIDPYQINRMKKKHSSSHKAINLAAQLVPGKEIIAFGVGRVVASSNPGFKKDDFTVEVDRATDSSKTFLVSILKEKLGFDDAFNYKEEPDLKSALKRYFPEGIDIYFDNVGGEMLEAAVANMNTFGRVAACGAIAEYTDKEKKAAPVPSAFAGLFRGDNVGKKIIKVADA